MSILRAPDLRIVRRNHNGYKPGFFKLTSDAVFLWESKNAVITIPSGFRSNFASIPPGLRNLFSLNGDHRLPAIVHDFLYDVRGYVLSDEIIEADGSISTPGSPAIIQFTRQEADLMFYRLMLEEGVPNFRACLMYRAVRCFGFMYAKGWTI